MKVRKGFVSNSSSSSFIVIEDSSQILDYVVPDELIVDTSLGQSEFGWEPETFYGVGSKIIFSYLQTIYSNNNDWLQMLTKVIKDHTGTSEIIWNITTEYISGGIGWSYIDHQSTAPHNTEMFENEEILKAFLFGRDSYIQTDNDNREDWGEY